MAGAVILDDLVGVPRAADDAVFVVFEPVDEIVSEGFVGVRELYLGEALHGFEGDPGVRVFFHCISAEKRKSRIERRKNNLLCDLSYRSYYSQRSNNRILSSNPGY
ncbi:MAG: hypothetical protein FD147_1209 [Chloroflexi bacterium]|nr:MAG: hypothetical protein FD147_1209 [Chloroflexota bacterium]